MELDTLRERAAAINDRLQVIRYDPPPVSLRTTLILVLVLLAAGWGWGWWVQHSRDAWWRDRIASSSAVVRQIVGEGTTAAIATDDDILKGLEDVDKRLAEAEQRLRATAQPDRGADARDQCRVPVECLRDGAGRDDGRRAPAGR